MTITLELIPWKRFYARKNEQALRDWLSNIGSASVTAFRRGMRTGKSGIKYSGQARRSSAAGEYPADQTGGLARTIRDDVSRNQVVVGSNAPYSGYLAYGTRKMAARKMSQDALEEGIERASGRMAHWVGWSRGSP